MEKFNVKDHTHKARGYGYDFVEVYQQPHQDDEEQFVSYGTKVLEDKTLFDGISINGKDLIIQSNIGTKTIALDMMSNEFPNDLDGRIPVQYMVRKRDRYNNYRYACGMDLLSNGMVWLGFHNGIFFQSINSAMEYLQDECGDGFYIQLEEPMQIGLAD
jgi:hypothetical protein